jgi:hypothetical protein
MRIQSASPDMKSTRFSFGIRLPNGLAPSFPRPMASVSYSEIRCVIVAHCKVWISNSRQKRAGKEMSSLCSSTTQSKGKYAVMHRCYGDESGVAERLKIVREVIGARLRFSRSVDADIFKSTKYSQEANIEILIGIIILGYNNASSGRN